MVNFAKTWLTGNFPEIWLFALGGMFIAVTLFMPKGIMGLVADFRQALLKRWPHRRKPAAPHGAAPKAAE